MKPAALIFFTLLTCSLSAGELSAGHTLQLGEKRARITLLEHLPFEQNDYSRRFRFDSAENPKLHELRLRYHLDDVVAAGRDEFEKQILLMDWVHHRFRKFGQPSISTPGALDILAGIERGETFFCTQYAQLFSSAAASLGWVNRVLALRRHQDPPRASSTEHSTTEIWSNQHRKWVMFDPTSNFYVEKNGVPLNAFELRQEWFYRDGKDLTLVIGRERRPFRKSDLPIYLKTFPGFGDLKIDPDELDKYGFIGYIPNTDLMNSGFDYGKMFIVKDQLCEGTNWHKRDNPANPAVEPYFPLGQSHLALKPADGHLQVDLKTFTPNLKEFQARENLGEWRPVNATFTWPVQPGTNQLRVRTVNRFGVAGPESAIELVLD